MEDTPKIKDTTKGFVRKRTLQATLQEVSQQMYARNKELHDTNRTLSLLSVIDSVALESQVSLNMVCEHIAEAITQATGYPFVGLLTQSRKDLKLSGWSSGSEGQADVAAVFEQPLHVEIANEWFDNFQSAKLFSLDGLSDHQIGELVNRTAEDVHTLRQFIGLGSVYIVKLHARRTLVGLLVVGFTQPPEQVTASDTALLNRLGESIGVALDNKLLFEENQRVLHQLELSNQKLKTLDETKDEFISMASHQLRTPLTSVKGYVSMVLEGDAGEINSTQKKLLEQSFASSQRMVYLISDLLNLSRLRTGKFIIEAKPTNLADVIESEVEQLRASAAGRNLTLTYKKPKKFPMLMMDETKIRQVIMNFSDNAIYYTPSGGKIELELEETAKEVRFTVNDNGIGIPKDEQHHLFGKFYRAKNAQKARPDGTGLGLFMAKKVIAAQGGAIIFKSTVGKGSTFGFSFSKEKLKLPVSQPEQ